MLVPYVHGEFHAHCLSSPWPIPLGVLAFLGTLSPLQCSLPLHTWLTSLRLTLERPPDLLQRELEVQWGDQPPPQDHPSSNSVMLTKEKVLEELPEDVAHGYPQLPGRLVKASKS